MKKIIALLSLSMIFAGCTNQAGPANSNEANNTNSNEMTEEKQVIEMQANEEESKEETETTEEVNNEEQEEASEEEETEKEGPEATEETEGESEEENKEDAEQASNKEPIAANDLVFLPLSVVRLGEDGQVTDENGDPAPTEAAYQYSYVKYSNNIFVKNEPLGQYWIVRVNDQDFTTLYEFPEGEEFTPLGMVGDKIYGYHSYGKFDEEKQAKIIDHEKTAIAVVDLATGEVGDFEATKGVSIGDAAVIEGELQFKIPGDNYPNDAYSSDLVKFDLSKGLDQEPELVEKDFDLQYLFGQKRFIDGKADWQIRRADNENIYVDDKTFPFLWAEQGFQDFIGHNIFYYTTAEADGDTFDPFLVHLKVVDTNTAETILEEDIRGMKLIDGKLYYLDKDANVKNVELSL